MLIGNKIDLTARAVSFEQAECYAKSHGMLYVEVSCKDGIGVENSFQQLISRKKNYDKKRGG